MFNIHLKKMYFLVYLFFSVIFPLINWGPLLTRGGPLQGRGPHFEDHWSDTSFPSADLTNQRESFWSRTFCIELMLSWAPGPGCGRVLLSRFTSVCADEWSAKGFRRFKVYISQETKANIVRESLTSWWEANILEDAWWMRHLLKCGVEVYGWWWRFCGSEASKLLAKWKWLCSRTQDTWALHWINVSDLLSESLSERKEG